jgi:hypothetical protein
MMLWFYTGDMTFHEFRSPGDARRFILQGLALCRVVRLQPNSVRQILQWLLEASSEGYPCCPPGFMADVAAIAIGGAGGQRTESPLPPSWPEAVLMCYDDQVVSRLFADRSLERAGDALRRLSGRDQARGLAFVCDRIRERAGCGGAALTPGAIKSLLNESPDTVVGESWAAFDAVGPDPVLIAQYEEWVRQIRMAPDALGAEDVFELESGMALAELGQRTAVRQVVRLAADLCESLPQFPPRQRADTRIVPTPQADEDAYPVGGFSSLSNRGSLESLLQSQLAFMERDPSDRPDLFDVKFLRDELLYYARDENQFYRRRRAFRIVFQPDLVAARWKDPDSPYQRIILTLAAVVAAIRKVVEWLATDALRFELQFPDDQSLAAERDILTKVLRVETETGIVAFRREPGDLARIIRIGADPVLEGIGVVVDRTPRCNWDDFEGVQTETGGIMPAWEAATLAIAELCVSA